MWLQRKAEKLNITIEFCIFQLVQLPDFKINWQFRFFGKNLPKKVFAVEIAKSEHNSEFYIFKLEENKYIFLAGDDALVYLAEPMHKKYSTLLLCLELPI